MEDQRTDSEIWHEAKEQGIILVPFSGEKSTITAAIREEDLQEACRRAGLDPDSWEDVYSLGLGFFVEVAAPGSGKTRRESYFEALKAFEELQPKANWKEQ